MLKNRVLLQKFILAILIASNSQMQAAFSVKKFYNSAKSKICKTTKVVASKILNSDFAATVFYLGISILFIYLKDANERRRAGRGNFGNGNNPRGAGARAS